MRWTLVATYGNYEKWLGESGESEITIELFENASSISFINGADNELILDAKRKINDILNDRDKDI